MSARNLAALILAALSFFSGSAVLAQDRLDLGHLSQAPAAPAQIEANKGTLFSLILNNSIDHLQMSGPQGWKNFSEYLAAVLKNDYGVAIGASDTERAPKRMPSGATPQVRNYAQEHADLLAQARANQGKADSDREKMRVASSFLYIAYRMKDYYLVSWSEGDKRIQQAIARERGFALSERRPDVVSTIMPVLNDLNAYLSNIAYQSSGPTASLAGGKAAPPDALAKGPSQSRDAPRQVAQNDIDMHALSDQKPAQPERLAPDKETMLNFIKAHGAQSMNNNNVPGWGGVTKVPGQGRIFNPPYLIAVLKEGYGARIPAAVLPRGGDGLTIQNCITMAYRDIATAWTSYYGADAYAQFVKSHYGSVVSADEIRADAKTRIAKALQSIRDGHCRKVVTDEMYVAFQNLLDDVQSVERQNIKVKWTDHGDYIEESVR